MVVAEVLARRMVASAGFFLADRQFNCDLAHEFQLPVRIFDLAILTGVSCRKYCRSLGLGGHQPGLAGAEVT